MLEVRQRQLSFNEQHAWIHAKRAVAAERHDRALW
jgi:hypothetical protein